MINHLPKKLCHRKLLITKTILIFKIEVRSTVNWPLQKWLLDAWGSWLGWLRDALRGAPSILQRTLRNVLEERLHQLLYLWAANTVARPPPEQRQREGHRSGAAGVDKTQGRLASDATCPGETLISHGHYQSQLYITMGNIGGLESHASGNLLCYLLLYVILSGCFQINCH